VSVSFGGQALCLEHRKIIVKSAGPFSVLSRQRRRSGSIVGIIVAGHAQVAQVALVALVAMVALVTLVAMVAMVAMVANVAVVLRFALQSGVFVG
jgi:hypothetical protein